jgi:hypothetical protein
VQALQGGADSLQLAVAGAIVVIAAADCGAACGAGWRPGAPADLGTPASCVRTRSRCRELAPMRLPGRAGRSRRQGSPFGLVPRTRLHVCVVQSEVWAGTCLTRGHSPDPARLMISTVQAPSWLRIFIAVILITGMCNGIPLPVMRVKIHMEPPDQPALQTLRR